MEGGIDFSEGCDMACTPGICRVDERLGGIYMLHFYGWQFQEQDLSDSLVGN